MRTVWLALSVVVAASAVTTPWMNTAEAQTGCAAESEFAHRVVSDFANAQRHALKRQQVGIVDSASVQLLTDADASVCESLYGLAQTEAHRYGGDLQGILLVAYRVGTRYVAVLVRQPDPAPPQPGYVRIQTGMVPVYVFDGNLRLLGTFGL